MGTSIKLFTTLLSILFWRQGVPCKTRPKSRWPARTIISLATSFGVASPAFGAQVWLAGRSNMPDYFELFKTGAPWARAAEHTAVFQINTQLLDTASDKTLMDIFANLAKRRIEIAWAALPLVATSVCGQGIEGYADSKAILRVTERVYRLHGQLRYIALDEPLWFGGFSEAPTSCHTPIGQLAEQVARNTTITRRIFPGVRIGDIEVLGTRTPRHWVSKILEWMDAYKAATGQPFAFFHADVDWAGPWREQLSELIPALRERGIKFGIIYDGNLDDQTSLAWGRRAELRFSAVESDRRFSPDDAIIQTWMPYPTNMLPETQPGTMTWLVRRYAAQEVMLTARRTENAASGKMTTVNDQPIQHAVIHLIGLTTGKSTGGAVHEFSGRVPKGAVSALVGIRVNSECDCLGSGNFTLRDVSYREPSTRQPEKIALNRSGTTTLKLNVKRAEQAAYNSRPFPVHEGVIFQFSEILTAADEVGTPGYVTLIFRNASGSGIERVLLWLNPAQIPLAQTSTNASGKFSFDLRSEASKADAGYEIIFHGTPTFRSAEAAVGEAPK